MAAPRRSRGCPGVRSGFRDRVTRRYAPATPAGGRYLRLGNRCVSDTATRETRWLPRDPDDARTHGWGLALVSPDGTRLARLGLADSASAAGAPRKALLLVADLVSLPDGCPPSTGVAAHRARSRAHAGFYIAPSGKLFFPGEPEDPQMQRAVVRRLGEAFDAELASGRLDSLFAAAERGAR